MKLRTAIRRYPLEAALIGSLLLHVGAALFIPATVAVSTDRTVETLAFSPTERIVIEPRILAVKPRPTHTHTAAPRRRGKPAPVPRAERPAIYRPLRQPVAVPVASVHAPQSTIAVQATIPKATGTPATTPTPTPVVKLASVAQNAVIGYLPLGAEQQNPVLDPHVLGALRALGIHVTLIITVDDNGKTGHIDFQPVLDAATEARITTLLQSARWDPSVCGGGVPCSGQAKIAL